MKEPIEPSDIRKGDLIRYEHGDDAASEWRSLETGSSPFRSDSGQHYLLDRPKPAVELPTEPTLGWIEGGNGPDLDFWRYRDPSDRANEGAWAGKDPDGKPRGYGIRGIEKFTPATAVPTAALDELRDYLTRTVPLNADPTRGWQNLGDRINRFLAAVDEAAR